MLVGERDAQAVDFQLGDIGDRRGAGARGLPDALVETAQLLLVVDVVEAEHRHEMRDSRKAFDRMAGDALRRRVRRDEIRVLGLELLEIVQQAIELAVGDFGSGVDVVALFVMADGVAKRFEALFGFHGPYIFSELR